jgi:DNA-binding XRE family transcriptional regulator
METPSAPVDKSRKAVIQPVSMSGDRFLAKPQGKLLRWRRERLGWTQEQMAKAVGTTRNTIARWERDEVGISKPMARLIESVYQAEIKKRG